MRISKRILQSNAVGKFLCLLGATYIRFVHATVRWTVINEEAPRGLWNSSSPFIPCLWHNRILMLPYSWDWAHPISMLISQHSDGQMIARTIGHFGFGNVAGSSSQGGAAALRQMVKDLKDGRSIGITPDGPRGPHMRASDGIIALARLSGVPILPVTYGVTRRKALSSWDRFIIALPFGRGWFQWGDPIYVPRDADAETLENLRLQVENALTDITHNVDRLSGHAPMKAAPVERASETTAAPIGETEPTGGEALP